FGITQYPGGRPPRKHHHKNKTIDTTAFNPNHWVFTLQDLNLKKSRFYIEYPNRPIYKGLFDANHLNITGINTHIENIKLVDDTVRAQVKSLAATERCGLSIRKMHADIEVSPVLSECKNLF